MKRPWQIWALFLLCLAVVLPAMGWLTVKAIELDRAEADARRDLIAARRREEAARRRAELEEDISRALWRMDTWLTPLVAQEAARPYFVYRTVYTIPASSGGKNVKGGKPAFQREVSPLVVNPSEYVLLNFEIAQDDRFTSPQCPVDRESNATAVANGATPEMIAANSKRLAQLRERTSYKDLWDRLPEKTLPAIKPPALVWNSNYELPPANTMPIDNVNDLGLAQLDRQVRQQIEDAQQQQKPAAQPSPNQSDEQARQPRQQAPPASQQGQQQYDTSRDAQTAMLRGGVEFDRRNRALQYQARQEVFNQRAGLFRGPEPPGAKAAEGVSRPLWVGSHLLLARRVSLGDRSMVQGCWLDWPRLKKELLGDVADLLPDADLVPADRNSRVSPSRMLATLPAQLVVRRPSADPAESPGGVPGMASLSPIRVSLWIAWACLSLALAAVTALLLGVVSLSERRASFVAAVTHELRTPLTTFRMYAEMLSEGMLSGEAKRQEYLETLRVEADRLTHLVSNVLAYARLERGRRGGRREDVSLGELVDRVRPRLADRARSVEMELVLQAGDASRDRAVRTDPAAVEQILFNLVDNACKYASGAEDRRIHLEVETAGRSAFLRVKDHGPGVSARAARRLFRPFCKSARDAAGTAPGVGLGLALCRRLARDLGGRLAMEKPNGEGASLVLTLPLVDSKSCTV